MTTVGVPSFPRRGGPSGERYNLYFNFPGHANRREGIMKRVSRRDSVGGLQINSAGDTKIWLPSEDFRDGDFFGPIGSFPTRVYLLQTGTYRVTYNVNATTGAATGASVKTRLGKNGAAGVVICSMSGMNVQATASMHGAAFASLIQDFTSGDYLEIVSTREGALAGALNTVQGGSSMQVELVSLPGEATLGGKQVITRSSYLQRAIVTKGVSGYSGTTAIRVLKNGLSVMGSSDLLLTSAQQFGDFNQTFFSVTNFDNGDLISLDVISEEAPYPRDLSVILQLAAAQG
jgi:hypothetical protein